MNNYVLDTNAIIYYLKKDSRAISVFKTTLFDHPLIYISVITELELFSFSNLSKDEITQIEHFLRSVSIIALDSRLARLAGFLRRTYHLKPLDAAIAATTMSVNSTLITRNIADFNKIPELQLLAV